MTPSNASTTQAAAAQLLAAGGTFIARWIEERTPEQLAKFESLLEAGGVPGADVLMATTGPVVALYIQAPDGTRHSLVSATAPALPPMQ